MQVDDLDLYTGGLAEVPTQGAVVGPTFACLIGRQMFYYKVRTRKRGKVVRSVSLVPKLVFRPLQH